MYEDMGRIWGAVKVDDGVRVGGLVIAGVDFSDKAKAFYWLEHQTAELKCAISSRAALRFCANVCLIQPVDLPLISISVLRALLTSSVRSTGESADVEWLDFAARSAAASADHFAHFSANSAAISASHSAMSAISTAQSATLSVESAIHSATRFTTRAAAMAAANQDSQNTLLTLLAKPLWPNGIAPAEIEQNHQFFLEFLNSEYSIWGFWHDWYLAMWEGRFADWDLAHEVAKIDNDVWEAGAETVAAEIERIKARRTLEAEVAALKEQLKQTQVVEQHNHRLHNNPPEAIESQHHLKSEITLIWELLEDIETEIAKPVPSPSALRVIADTLWEISLRIGKYCASLADVALKKSAEVIGETGTKAAIGLLVTTTAAQNEGVKSVAHAIWEFVKTLPAG